MQSDTRSPATIFGLPTRYVVPIFQRPYVWNREDQWKPLWEDVRTLAERLGEATADPYGGGPRVAPHFLGAVVLDEMRGPTGFIGVRHIIDGQQRLTTLQIVLDAARRVVAQHGAERDAQALRVVVLNDHTIAQSQDEVFKVWPTDSDQDAFRAVIGGDDGGDLPDSRIARAHRFFRDRILEWSVEAGDQQQAYRLGLLVQALRDHLRLVVIDLEPGDNAQVIFETLNHRGSPLLAADLVKNLVFQIAQAQQADVTRLYGTHWKELDTDDWRRRVAQGRVFRPRVDTFLNHWLTMTLLSEVPADRVFDYFRDYVQKQKPPIPQLLATLSEDARTYRDMEKADRGSRAGVFHYRVVQALNSRVVSPLLLWLLRWGDRMPEEQRIRALDAVESWVVRRALCRATTKDLNRLVVDLLKVAERAGPEEAGSAIEAYLATQRADSRYWPSDEVLRETLLDAPVYRTLTRPRLRMVLEALEDRLRSDGLGEGQACPRNLTIEHVMPQAWRERWTDLDGDEAAGVRRDCAVHAFGNLTLVTGRLNPSLSNRPWTDETAAGQEPGSRGKRTHLLDHSHLTLNARLVSGHPDCWTEPDITARTATMTDALATIWPRPADVPDSAPVTLDTEPAADEPEDEPDVTGHDGRYRLLHDWLRDQQQEQVATRFADVEEVLGFALPASSRTHAAHWYGYEGTAVGRAVRDAGWKASGVDLTDERVTFVRAPA